MYHRPYINFILDTEKDISLPATVCFYHPGKFITQNGKKMNKSSEVQLFLHSVKTPIKASMGT
jgi:hypothetical protein